EHWLNEVCTRDCHDQVMLPLVHDPGEHSSRAPSHATSCRRPWPECANRCVKEWAAYRRASGRISDENEAAGAADASSAWKGDTQMDLCSTSQPAASER